MNNNITKGGNKQKIYFSNDYTKISLFLYIPIAWKQNKQNTKQKILWERLTKVNYPFLLVQ